MRNTKKTLLQFLSMYMFILYSPIKNPKYNLAWLCRFKKINKSLYFHKKGFR